MSLSIETHIKNIAAYGLISEENQPLIWIGLDDLSRFYRDCSKLVNSEIDAEQSLIWLISPLKTAVEIDLSAETVKINLAEILPLSELKISESQLIHILNKCDCEQHCQCGNKIDKEG